MNGYINSLLVMLVICMLVTKASPEGETKKHIRLICSLAVLLTMIAPIRELVSSAAELGDKVSGFFSSESEADSVRDGYSAAAATLISYIGEKYPDVGGKVTVTFVTDDDGRITEAQFFLPSAGEELCERIERELGSELTVTVNVFGGG